MCGWRAHGFRVALPRARPRNFFWFVALGRQFMRHPSHGGFRRLFPLIPKVFCMCKPTTIRSSKVLLMGKRMFGGASEVFWVGKRVFGAASEVFWMGKRTSGGASEVFWVGKRVSDGASEVFWMGKRVSGGASLKQRVNIYTPPEPSSSLKVAKFDHFCVWDLTGMLKLGAFRQFWLPRPQLPERKRR